MAIFTEDYCISLIKEQQSQYKFQDLPISIYSSRNPQLIVDAANDNAESIWQFICQIAYNAVYNNCCYWEYDAFENAYFYVDSIWYDFEKEYKTPDAIRRFIFLSEGKIDKDILYINFRIIFSDSKYRQFNFTDNWIKVIVQGKDKIKCKPVLFMKKNR